MNPNAAPAVKGLTRGDDLLKLIIFKPMEDIMSKISLTNGLRMCALQNVDLCSRVCVWRTGVITTLASESTLWLDS